MLPASEVRRPAASDETKQGPCAAIPNCNFTEYQHVVNNRVAAFRSSRCQSNDEAYCVPNVHTADVLINWVH